MPEVLSHTMIPLTSPDRWRNALEGVPYAFGHTWESCYAMHLTTGYRTYLYYYDSGSAKVVCPVAERTFDGYLDLVTPYGFSGFTGSDDVAEFYREWKAFAQDQGYICGYIGLNPVLERSSYLDDDDAFEYNKLYVLDLRQSKEELFRKLSTNRKRQLKDYAGTAKYLTADKAFLKSFFLEQYHDFFSQRNAAQVYNFSAETLSYIIDLDNVLVVGAVEDNKVKAVSVFGYTPYTADYLFNVSANEGKNYTVPLIWYAVNYLQESNIPMLNLGGGVRQGDSLSQFKERFGGITYTLKCLKQVYAPLLYEQLCKEANANPDKGGYFPPYRRSR